MILSPISYGFATSYRTFGFYPLPNRRTELYLGEHNRNKSHNVRIRARNTPIAKCHQPFAKCHQPSAKCHQPSRPNMRPSTIQGLALQADVQLIVSSLSGDWMDCSGTGGGRRQRSEASAQRRPVCRDPRPRPPATQIKIYHGIKAP
jgi:hypothetical protein